MFSEWYRSFVFFFSKIVFVRLKHLQDKGRTDDLFNDTCYEMFGEELNKVLKDWQPSVLPDGKNAFCFSSYVVIVCVLV